MTRSARRGVLSVRDSTACGVVLHRVPQGRSHRPILGYIRGKYSWGTQGYCRPCLLGGRKLGGFPNFGYLFAVQLDNALGTGENPDWPNHWGEGMCAILRHICAGLGRCAAATSAPTGTSRHWVGGMRMGTLSTTHARADGSSPCLRWAKLKPDWAVHPAYRASTHALMSYRAANTAAWGEQLRTPAVHADSEQRSAALALGAHGVYRLWGKARVQYGAFD